MLGRRGWCAGRGCEVVDRRESLLYVCMYVRAGAHVHMQRVCLVQVMQVSGEL